VSPGLAAPRAAIFDWDNTLVDSWGCIREALNSTLVAMDHEPWTEEMVKARVALSLRDTFPAMFGTRWEEARDIFYKRFEEIHIEWLRPLPGAEEMLIALAAMKIRLAVVSNKRGEFLRHEARALGWDRLFDRLIGASDAAADKPDPAPVRLALAACGVEAGEHVWFLGDAAVDLQCAVNAGCVPILLRAEPPGPEEFPTHPPRHHFAAFSYVTGLVRALAAPIS
jgi:phosphoglycolate phosphatase